MAVLLVVAFHAGTFVRGGFVGVDVFFVISGFVITTSLLRELRRSDTIDLPAFYARRIRRLLPALGLVILVVVLISVTELDPAGGRQAVTATARAASLFFANLHLERVGGGYFAQAVDRNPLLHTWSLSIEEQFYAFLPPVMLGAWALGRRRGRPERWMQGAIVAVTLVSFGWAALVVGRGDLRAAFYLPQLRAWEFCVGALLAMQTSRLARLRTTAASVIGGVGAVLTVGAALLLSGAAVFPGPTALAPVVGAALVIAGGTSGRAAPGLRSGWLVWLGDRSYSWYLWHWPLLTFAAIHWPDAGWARLVASVVALAPAAASYALVERPIRAERRIVGLAAIALACTVILVPLATSVVVERSADRELARRAPELAELTKVWVSGCDELPWPAPRCTFGPPDPRGTIALIGDSHASVLGDVVTEVGDELGMRTVAFTKAGCPASLVPPRPTDTGGCAPWLAATLDTVRGIDPDVIVVANRSPLYVLGRENDTSGRRPIAATPDEAVRVWTAGLRDLFEQLDTPTLLVQTFPEQPSTVVHLIGTAVTDDDVPALSVDAHEARSGAIDAAERRVADEFTQVSVFDPASVLCSESCPAFVDGSWRYFDGNHLTPRATLLFADEIRTQLRRLLSGELTGANS